VLQGFADMTSLVSIVAIAVVIIGLVQRLRESNILVAGSRGLSLLP
jgi:hypothetical protein